MMDKFMFLALIGCSVTFLHQCEGDKIKNWGYLFTAPKRLLAGEIESGCLSLHNLELPAHVLLELLTLSGEEVLANTSTVLKTGIETCLQLAVPLTEHNYGILRLKIKFDKLPHYVVESEENVDIEKDTSLTFVETDKSIYKPGQDVNIRILMLKHDLKPWKKPIPQVWIENSSGIKVVQWTNVSMENGMVQLAFPLSPEPSSGTWWINVKKNNFPYLIHITSFEVGKYVLPKFQITINSPQYILATAENITWNICVKYSYGKPVKGTLLLNLTPRTPSWTRKPNLSAIHYEMELDKPDGCTDFVLTGTVLGLAHWKKDPNNIILVAEFTEAGTGVVETTFSRTVVMHQALKLEYERYSPKYFKLGLPYHGKLRVLHHDDTPAPNEKIEVCLKLSGKIDWKADTVECRKFISSIDGFVDFVVPPQHKNVVLLTFVATAVDHRTTYSSEQSWRVLMDQPMARIIVNPWYSPSDSYITVARGNQPIVCGEKYSFNVMYTIPPNMNETISFHYSINSKGSILIYGHVKHKPSRDTVLNYSEFRNLLGTIKSSANKTDDDPVVHRFPLSVKVTPSMAPVSELLLYYVRSDSEVVATIYTIEVSHCFENKVKTAWHTDVQTPGSTTQYHIEAAPWSLCGITAVDKSTLFLGKSKSNLINATQTFDNLRRFHPTQKLYSPHRSNCKLTGAEGMNEEIEHFPAEWGRLKRHTITYDRHIKYVDAMQAFYDFGVIVMSDLVLETRPCPRFFKEDSKSSSTFLMINFMDRSSADYAHDFAVAAAAMDPGVGYVDQYILAASTLRSYFPETWLWELVPTGKEGKVTIERKLPHTITDWVGYTTCISPVHGLGIAPPTTITAFQQFFLDYSLPYSIKHGEMMHLKVSLFNYMNHSLPVKIKLEEVAGIDLHLTHPTASYCVKPQDTIVHEYILRPRVIGEVNITVAAFIDIDYSEPCGPETLIFARDTIVKPILILPEGFPVVETKSAFICPMNFSDDSMSTWELMLPEDIVPASGRAYLNLIGDILGSVFENLDNLVQLPRGCGEQNMVLLVPNIHVVKYLDAFGINNPALRAEAIRNIEIGYQNELNYKLSDGSYVPLRHMSSSIWLTAFVLKSFAYARDLIPVRKDDLLRSANWIKNEQLWNGCFRVKGYIFHKQMKGGLNEYAGSSTALTAYILIALIESGFPLTASLTKAALNCLEQEIASGDNGPYATILTTYALALIDHPKANSSMKSLMNIASRHHNLIWWEDKTKPSIGLSIEMTAYVILTLVKLGGNENMVEAMKAVRWLSKQRNTEGGFTSTQDTIVGLEALTKYALVVNGSYTNLSLLVTAKDVDYVYKLHNDNRMVLTQIRLPSLPTTVEIFVEGEGCVLVQSNLKYNVKRTTGSDAFDLSIGIRPVSYENECSIQEITICARYKMDDEESNMALLEIEMISSYVPDRGSLNALLESSSNVKRFEEDQNVVTIYFDKLTGRKTCISFKIVREYIVDRLEPANVKLYDYYQQEFTVSTNYEIASICSSAEPVTEEVTPNLPVDANHNEKFNLQHSKLEIPNFMISPVVVSHSLESFDGIEGSIPVYVKQDNYDDKTEPTITTNGLPKLTTKFETEDQTAPTVVTEDEESLLVEPDIEINNTTTITETNIPSPTGTKQSCPVCMDKLPSDISNVYCSAVSATKVAIRRWRKARLLLDLHATREIQRRHAKIEFTLSPNCSCSPLDNPGSFALIINKDNDFLANRDHKHTLNSSFHIYGLPLVSGIPCKLAEARATCFNEENIQCTNENARTYV